MILQEERILSVGSENLPGFVISDWISFFFYLNHNLHFQMVSVTSVRVSMIAQLGLSMQLVCGTFYNMSLWVSLFISSSDMTYRSIKHVSLVFLNPTTEIWMSVIWVKTVEALKIPMTSCCHNESFIWERLAQTQRYSPQGHWKIFFGKHIFRTSACHWCFRCSHACHTTQGKHTSWSVGETVPRL